MMGDADLDEFFAHIDEISQDSACTDQYQQIQKLKTENNRLKVFLNNLRSSTREVLEIVKSERQQKLNAFQELERANLELEKLRSSYEELDKSNINNQFKFKESLDELELKHHDEHENHIELAQDYFSLLEEVTTFYNFEIKRDRNKLLCKTSNFLEDALGDKFQKPKLVVRRSSSSDSKSTASKRSRGSKGKSQNIKRRKIDIWEMKSISEASSPMSFHEDVAEETIAESEYSFRTFSIGNETAFTAVASNKVVKNFQCKCQVVTKDPDLVSVGTNTDDLEPETLKSLPSFSDIEELHNDEFNNSPDLVNNTKDLPVISESESSQSLDDILNVNCDPIVLSPPKKIETKSIGTETDKIQEPLKQMKDQSTSIVVDKCSKYTSTIHSVTHRGTMTNKKVTRNIGIQFPDITYEKIMEEMMFDLPSCISPIVDEIEDVKSSKETQTDLHNVNREVDYVVHIKPDNSDDKKTLSNEEKSFMILGQTVFNLFMSRLKESNKSLDDDANTRERLREQLLDRFDEFTFDDYFSPTFVSSEAQENVLRRVFEDVRDTKVQKKTNYEKSVPSCDESPLKNQLNSSSSDESIATKVLRIQEISREYNLVDPIPEIEDLCMDIVPQSSSSDISINTQVSSESIATSSKSSEQIIVPEDPAQVVTTFSDIELSSQSSQEVDTEFEDIVTKIPEKTVPIEEPTVSSKELIAQIEPNVQIEESNVQIEEADVQIEEQSIQLEEPQEKSSINSQISIKSFTDLDVSLESSEEEAFEEIAKNCESEKEVTEPPASTNNPQEANSEVNSKNAENDEELMEINQCSMDTDEILGNIESLCSTPRLVSPIADLTDLIWSSIFPDTEVDDEETLPVDDKVLDGYDIEHEPIEIPVIAENGTESPYPPPALAITTEAPYDPIEIPLDSVTSRKKNSAHGKVLEYDAGLRMKLVTWQQNNQFKKNDDKRLCKIRKSINNYLNSDWTDENLEKCLSEISSKREQLLVEALFETVEDNQWQKEINSEFTPPAPPLPRYQQKLILLISKLAESHPELPHQLVIDLEMKIFKCENSSAELDYLRNVSYYYSALIDLFFNGDPTIVFYFIIKCIYFYGYKSIPMIFVLIKAFPQTLPKKSTLLKKYSSNIDWEKMSGLEMSKIRLDLEWMDSLDLCVMYLLTNIQMYRRKGQEFKVIYEHELFNYLPKMYGFPLTFLAAPKLLDILIKRLEDGELKNLSMSLILLGKRMNKDFTVRMLLKGKLIPLLKKYVDESLSTDSPDEKLIDRICLLIESISTILKPLTDEKDKLFNEVFPMTVNILGRTNNQKVQEYCIKAILRLQRFIENHKEIYEIIKHHYEKQNSFSESLRYAIATFVARKKEAYFKE
ncbi:synaptonemal complex protein 1-like isoform X2 [Chironomus tepperi]|uniref:synaptonemal complex protein 1-like isoform X2 n=1 Tax=Chironomus tepperi TaxID=113505 RepID=UPI00391F6B90